MQQQQQQQPGGGYSVAADYGMGGVTDYGSPMGAPDYTGSQLLNVSEAGCLNEDKHIKIRTMWLSVGNRGCKPVILLHEYYLFKIIYLSSSCRIITIKPIKMFAKLCAKGLYGIYKSISLKNFNNMLRNGCFSESLKITFP